jgi:predicted tellurium resistance membrane protein TerC
MLELFLQPEALMIFATLFALEVVLGVEKIKDSHILAHQP